MGSIAAPRSDYALQIKAANSQTGYWLRQQVKQKTGKEYCKPIYRRDTWDLFVIGPPERRVTGLAGFLTQFLECLGDSD